MSILHRLKIYGILVAGLLAGVACNQVSTDEEGGANPNDSEWLIPSTDIYVGASRDQIQSIDDPVFTSMEEIDFMRDDDLIIALKINGKVRGYPHKVLNYHEIVNDNLGGKAIALTFCPLTGSAITWERVVNRVDTTTFGVSGKIFKNNLIAYDRETDSEWSQMLVQSVHGPLREARPPQVFHSNSVEMNWKTWKQAFPEAKVLSGTPIMSHAYTLYPYGEDYPTNNSNIVFPIGNEDDRLERKTLSHGINYHSNPVVFPVDDFSTQTSVLNYSYEGGDVVVAGNAVNRIAVSFSRVFNGEVQQFRLTDQPLPAIMEDSLGNVWDVFGEAISGPDEGKHLREVSSYNAYWFAWADFYPEVSIYYENH